MLFTQWQGNAYVALIGSNAHNQNTHTLFSCTVNMAKQFGTPFVSMCPIRMCAVYYSYRLHAQTAMLFVTYTKYCMLYSKHCAMLDTVH